MDAEEWRLRTMRLEWHNWIVSLGRGQEVIDVC
jgi:hypothetical protein